MISGGNRKGVLPFDIFGMIELIPRRKARTKHWTKSMIKRSNSYRAMQERCVGGGQNRIRLIFYYILPNEYVPYLEELLKVIVDNCIYGNKHPVKILLFSGRK